MAFAKRKLTVGQMERRRRLLIILPEILELLEERKKDKTLTTKEIKEVDITLIGVNRFFSRLHAHESTHDCHLATVVGSPAIGNMYNAIFGKKYVSTFLRNDYYLSQEAFKQNEMDVPFVLEELYKKYTRFDAPVDETEMRNVYSSALCSPFDC